MKTEPSDRPPLSGLSDVQEEWSNIINENL